MPSAYILFGGGGKHVCPRQHPRCMSRKPISKVGVSKLKHPVAEIKSAIYFYHVS